MKTAKIAGLFACVLGAAVMSGCMSQSSDSMHSNGTNPMVGGAAMYSNKTIVENAVN